MGVERTLSIIKPCAVRRSVTGKIVDRLESGGLRVVAQKRVRWSASDAEEFYSMHRGRPFFEDLTAFMTSGPIVLQVLEGECAVARNREIMGATDPKEAADGTIRRDFAESIEANAVHGSDSLKSAEREIALCFNYEEIVG